MRLRQKKTNHKKNTLRMAPKYVARKAKSATKKIMEKKAIRKSRNEKA